MNLLTQDTLPLNTKGFVRAVITNHGYKRFKERYGMNKAKEIKTFIQTSIKPKNILKIENGKSDNVYKIYCSNGSFFVVKYKKEERLLVVVTVYLNK